MLLPNLPPAVEGIHHEESRIKAYVNQRDMGIGTLYIAESHMSWAKEGGEGGFSLQYPHIAVHAITRDTSRFPEPCIYIALDVDIEEGAIENGFGDEHTEDDEDSKMSEIRFVPHDAETLETMYKSLNECQVLHPDPQDELSEEDEAEEDEGEYDVIENGYSNGHHYFNENYEGAMEDELEGHDDDEDEGDMETGQFEDANM